MIRIRTLATGVAGAPWYLNAYFGGLDVDAVGAAMPKWLTFLEAVANTTSNAITFTTDPTVPQINPATGEQTGVYVGAVGSPISGGDTNEMLPGANQLVLNLRTGVYTSGRQIQGRLNLPGRTASSVGPGGTVDASVQGALTSAAQGLLDDTPNRGLVVFSRKTALAVTVRNTAISSKFGVLKTRRD